MMEAEIQSFKEGGAMMVGRGQLLWWKVLVVVGDDGFWLPFLLLVDQHDFSSKNIVAAVVAMGRKMQLPLAPRRTSRIHIVLCIESNFVVILVLVFCKLNIVFL